MLPPSSDLPPDFAARVMTRARGVRRRRSLLRSATALCLCLFVALGVWRSRSPVAGPEVFALDEASWARASTDDPGALLLPGDLTEDSGALIAMGGDELLSE
jgi:hypothetical protein